MERCPSQSRLFFFKYSLLRPALPFHEIFPATLQKHTRKIVSVSADCVAAPHKRNGCVIFARGHGVWVEKKAANTRLIRRLMMDSAAKTLSPTAESSMAHHAPRLFLSLFFYYFFGFPRVLPGLFNSAHPIIRDSERTSSRLFLLPGTAVGRTDRGGAHWLGCCYVLRLCRAEGRSPAALAVGQECLARWDTRDSRCGSTEPPGGSPKEWESGWVRSSRKSCIFTNVYTPMRESESQGGAERGA